MPAKVAPSDVGAELLAVEPNGLGVLPTPLLGFLECRRDGCHSQDATPRGSELAVGAAARPGMEDRDPW
jgi:hypothetical protein